MYSFHRIVFCMNEVSVYDDVRVVLFPASSYVYVTIVPATEYDDATADKSSITIILFIYTHAKD